MPTLDPHQNPYHPFEEPTQYQAFEDGWTACHQGTPVSELPYSMTQSDAALAWLDGWTVANENDAEPRARRRDTPSTVDEIDDRSEEGNQSGPS